LSAAIQAAQPGDEIILESGVYQESNISIDKPLMIRGQNMPIIDANFENEIIIIRSDSVTIEGIEFRNAGRSHLEDLAAIRVQKKKHFVIRNNRIINSFFGIYIENGKKGRIDNNLIISYQQDEMSAGNAIHCWYADSLEIHYNTVKGHRDGIYLEFVNNSAVTNNLSEQNTRYGLHFMFSNEDLYSCNTFRSNGAGVAVMFSKKIQMLYNSFEHNWGQASYGLLLKEIYDAKIEGNRFLKNTIGVLLEGSTRLEYHHNVFINNGWAIQISGGCLDNHFYQNNFISNTLDLIIKSRINNNTFDGNYWSEYTGYDLDRDGIGDVPHRPVKLFSFVLEQAPESIILLRSFFIDLLNYSEKVSPIFTPANVLDHQPLIFPMS
jgi:nitrous oxidase accessory protein